MVHLRNFSSLLIDLIYTHTHTPKKNKAKNFSFGEILRCGGVSDKNGRYNNNNYFYECDCKANHRINYPNSHWPHLDIAVDTSASPSRLRCHAFDIQQMFFCYFVIFCVSRIRRTKEKKNKLIFPFGCFWSALFYGEWRWDGEAGWRAKSGRKIKQLNHKLSELCRRKRNWRNININTS